MKEITLYRSTTAVRATCTSSGYFEGDLTTSVHPFLRDALTEKEWDFRFKKVIVKYYYFKYDKTTELLHMPAHITDDLVRYIKNKSNCSVRVVDLPANPYVTTNITYTGDKKLYDDQVEAVAFLTNADNPEHMRSLSLACGGGKTFIAIKTVLALQRRALVILPASLVEQWAAVFSELSDVKILILKGNKSIYDLVKADYSTDADVILTSIQTMQEYAIGGETYSDAPQFRDFIRGLKVGVKIVDECHLNFNANVMIDIQSDVDRNIYLSATHIRTSKGSNAIFAKIFPKKIRYGNLNIADHINVTEVHYNIGQIDQKRISTDRGYSQVMYEKYILRNGRKLDHLLDIITTLIDDYFIKLKQPGQKLLILAGRVDFCEVLNEYLAEIYPKLVCNKYTSGTPDSVLEISDVVCSTVGSCGTGKDIPGLRTLIMFTSFSSEVLAYQTLGRLRKMKNGDVPEFVYMVNAAIDSHRKHANLKRDLYKTSVKSFDRIDL